MTLKEMTRKGGLARAQALTKERRIEIARNAGLASARKRTSKQEQETCQSDETPENKNN